MSNEYQANRFKTIMKAGAELFGDILDSKYSGNDTYQFVSSIIGSGPDDKHTFSKTLSKVTTKCINYKEVSRDNYKVLEECSHVEIFFRPGDEIYNLDQIQLNRIGIR